MPLHILLVCRRAVHFNLTRMMHGTVLTHVLRDYKDFGILQVHFMVETTRNYQSSAETKEQTKPYRIVTSVYKVHFVLCFVVCSMFNQIVKYS